MSTDVRDAITTARDKAGRQLTLATGGQRGPELLVAGDLRQGIRRILYRTLLDAMAGRR